MPKEILLLTDANEAAGLIPLLSDAAPGLPVTLVQSLGELETACHFVTFGERRPLAIFF